MDAIQFLMREHQKAKAAFAKVLTARPAEREALWDELQPELEAHEEIETQCLYDPLSEEGSSDSRLVEWVSDGHEEEVQKVEALIEEMEGLDPEDPDAPLFALYSFLGWLLEHIVQALAE